MTQLLEGTWEEISQHADELKGRYLKIAVLDAQPSVTQATVHEETLMEALDRIGSIDGPPTDISGNAEDLWGAVFT